MPHPAGLLERTGRGLCILPDAELTEYHSLAEVAQRVPAGIACLLSALRLYDLTTWAPFEVWLALPPAARRPRPGSPPLRVRAASGARAMPALSARLGTVPLDALLQYALDETRRMSAEEAGNVAFVVAKSAWLYPFQRLVRTPAPDQSSSVLARKSLY